MDSKTEAKTIIGQNLFNNTWRVSYFFFFFFYIIKQQLELVMEQQTVSK